MAKKATDIEIRTDNIYCPHCGAIQPKTESFCSHCGKSLHTKNEDEELGEKVKEIQKTSPEKPKKPLYKNKVFLFMSGLLAIAISVLGIVFYLKSNEGNVFKTKVKAAFLDVTGETEDLNKEITAMSQMDDFKKIAIKIKTIEDVISNNQEELNRLKTPDNFRDGKESLLLGFSDYKSYLQILRSAADNPSKMTDQDIDEITNLSETAKTSFSKTYIKFDFLDKKIPDETYNIVSRFQEVRKNYEDKLAGEEQAKAEQERQQKQLSDDKAKAESLVISFMNAYIAGNEAELKKYMTAAFQKEFNYADMSGDARLYSYPESFRITTTKKASDTQYDIYGRELQVNRESGSKWTINRHFAAIWVQSESKWLIDRWDISSE